MKAIETNIHRHENGMLYFVARKKGELFVQSLKTKELGEARRILEQPEIHLHPALQAELADVFIESALGDQKNIFLLETHSEHILLRLMKRMRQTQEQNLPEGTCPITPNDVSLLFVSPGSEGSVVQDIGLNARGELVKSWPGGFFEEGFNEMFN